jgi:hypothetical protein
MVQLSWFYGIKVSMYYSEHMPPHFHVEYGDHTAEVDIPKIRVIQGRLPKKQLNLILAWTVLHQDELMDNWHRAFSKQEMFKIDPLR